MRVTNERRAAPRAPLEASAVVFIGDRRVRCRVVDVSAGGLAVRAPVNQPPGQFLRVNFPLGARSWVDVDAVIARSAEAGDGEIWGLRFVTLSEQHKRRIESYVEQASVAQARAKQAQVFASRHAAVAQTHPGPPSAAGEAGAQARRTPMPATVSTRATGERPAVRRTPTGPLPTVDTPAPPPATDAPRRTTGSHEAVRGRTGKSPAAGRTPTGPLPVDEITAPRRRTLAEPPTRAPRPTPSPGGGAAPPKRRSRPEPPNRELMRLFRAAVAEIDGGPDGKKKKKKKAT